MTTCKLKWIVSVPMAVAMLAASAARAQAIQPAKHPNIIFMLIDDLGWGELGCYGNTFNETPRIDKFATTAMRFTEAYCQPTCSPTRASLMTGQYPHRTGIEDYLDYNSPTYLDPNKEYTVNQMLSVAGYLTCHIGKWHLDTHFQNPKGSSKQFGFDEVIGTETKYIADGDYFFPFDKIRTLPEVTPHEFLPDRLSDEAVGFIERAHARGQPFFLYYAEYAVHADLDAPAELVEKYRRKYDAKHGPGSSKKFDNKHHLGQPDNIYMGAMAERVDAGLGKILDTLDRLGIADNTVVFLLSDNGGDGRTANNGGLRGAKGQVWEGGIRDPQIVRWPGVTKPGSVCDQPTLTIDYYPTFAEITGAEIPAQQKIDGTSLVPLLRGELKLNRPAPLFWHYPADTAPWPDRAGGVCRDGDFKLVEIYRDGHFEMFNIKKDPDETQNLIAAMPEKFAELKAKLLDWQKKLGIDVPKPAPRKQSSIEAPPRTDLYQEKYRPQFHFSARQWTESKLNPGQREEGWMNDPNGLIYFQGVYHLFAQRWDKCWIHAVSKNLVHWTELQPAFCEDGRFGAGVQSGGAVVDKDNTSGLAPDAKTPPLVAFWAGGDNRSQCISYSLDSGRTWKKYDKNPVIVHPERDPKVFWYEPDKRWIMVLSDGGAYRFFTSKNLLEWKDQKYAIADSFECPDMFQLPVDGDLNRQKWVLVRGNGKYSIGEFDGAKFTPETSQLPCDLGANFYATQSWGDIDGQPGRRVQIAWMRGGRYPEMPFNQQMTFPCDLTLRSFPDGLRICRLPVGEIKSIYEKNYAWQDTTIKPGDNLLKNVSGDLFDIQLQVDLAGAKRFGIKCRGEAVTYSAETRALTCRGREAKLDATSGRITLRMLIDRTSIEVFANDGKVSMSSCFLPDPENAGLELFSDGNLKVLSLTVCELKSAWPASKSD